MTMSALNRPVMRDGFQPKKGKCRHYKDAERGPHGNLDMGVGEYDQ